MSHYESTFQGLTGPSKAGLALALILSAAMVAASPELRFSPPMPFDIPTAWLGQFQHDSLPQPNDILHMVTSTLSLRVGAMQDVITENAAKWHELLEARSFESQKILDLIDEKLTSDALRLQNFLTHFGTDMESIGTNMLKNGLSKLASVGKSMSTHSQQIQSEFSTHLEEFQARVMPPMEQGLEDIKAIQADFRKASDGTVLLDGSLLNSKLVVVRLQTFLEYQNDEIRRFGIEPALKANTDFWNSFDTEVIREHSVLKQTAEDVASHLESVTDATVRELVELKNIRVPELSRKALDLIGEENERMQEEAMRFQYQTLPSMVAKVDSLSNNANTVLSDSRLRLECAANEFSSTIAALKTELRSLIGHFTSQTRSHLEEWNISTNAGILEQKAVFSRLYHGVTARAANAFSAAAQMFQEK
jgi:hypothetical protein